MMFKSMNTYIAYKAIFKLNLKSLCIAFILFGAESKCIAQKNALLHKADLANKELYSIVTNEDSSSHKNNEHKVGTNTVNEDNDALSGEVICFRRPDGKFMNLLKVNSQKKTKEGLLFSSSKEIKNLSTIKFSNNVAELFDSEHNALGTVDMFLEVSDGLVPFLPFLSKESSVCKNVKITSMADADIPTLLNDAVSDAAIKKAPYSNKAVLQSTVNLTKLGSIKKTGFILVKPGKPGVVTSLIESIITQSIELSSELDSNDDYIIRPSSCVNNQIALTLPYVDSAYTTGFLYMRSDNRVYIVPLKSITDPITKEIPSKILQPDVPVKEEKNNTQAVVDEGYQTDESTEEAEEILGDKENTKNAAVDENKEGHEKQIVDGDDQTSQSNLEVGNERTNNDLLESGKGQIEGNKQEIIKETSTVENAEKAITQDEKKVVNKGALPGESKEEVEKDTQRDVRRTVQSRRAHIENSDDED